MLSVDVLTLTVGTPNLEVEHQHGKLNISIGTSKSNLAKAKKSLKKILLKETRHADE